MPESVTEKPLPEEFWQRLSAGEVVPFCASGQSMRPFLRSGTWVLLQQAPLSSLHVGDVVLMKIGDRATLHRIRQVHRTSESSIITRGDSYQRDDAPWQTSQYKARVMSVLGQSQNANSMVSRYHEWICCSFRFGGPIVCLCSAKA